MKTIDAIIKRRAVKYFDATHNMGQYKTEQFMSLAKLAPTVFNQQNTRFVLVYDKEL